MTTPDELERAVERLCRMRDDARDGTAITDPNEWEADELTDILAAFRLLLSERAELLAAVERLETALIQKADEGMLVLETLAALSPNQAHRHVKEGLAMARQARAALTTGEEK